LVYTDDPNNREKALIGTQLVEQHLLRGEAVLSTQVLQEYFVTTTQKIGTDPLVARRKVELFSSMDVVRIDVPLILAAIDLHRLHSLSFWDALIVQAASAAGCAELISEDMQAGRAIAGLRIVNPFV
jgi:predicted nucleic acid-binding protein